MGMSTSSTVVADSQLTILYQLEIFRRPSYRKRAILAMGFAFLGQSTAELVINNYGPLLYSELGYGTEDQLRFQCGWITTIIITNILSALIVNLHSDRCLDQTN